MTIIDLDHDHVTRAVQAPRDPDRLAIAIVAPPWIAIPPPAYGGIEQVVALQAQVLADAGHEVTLYAAPGTDIAGVRCVSPLPDLPAFVGEAVSEWHHLLDVSDALDDADIVIDHSGPLGASLMGAHGVPLLHVTHGELQHRTIRIYEGLAARNPALKYVAISESQRSSAPSLPFAGVALNGLDVTDIPFNDAPDGYLAFLGRMAPEKGAAEAIAIARAAGLPIQLAAKCREPAEIAYFEQHVAPHVGDEVIWLGEVGADEKYALLRGAQALLFPIDWSEPFGMVMIEAMACGTPVVATRRGAVPEIVVNGVTGFVCDEVEALADAVGRLSTIDRAECRRHVVENFGSERFAQRWEAVIRRHLRNGAARPGSRLMTPTSSRPVAAPPLDAVA